MNVTIFMFRCCLFAGYIIFVLLLFAICYIERRFIVKWQNIHFSQYFKQWKYFILTAPKSKAEYLGFFFIQSLYTHLNFISLCESIATECSPLYFLHSGFLHCATLFECDFEWMRKIVLKFTFARVSREASDAIAHRHLYVNVICTQVLEKKWERKQKSGIFHIKVLIFPIYTAENISIWTK